MLPAALIAMFTDVLSKIPGVSVHWACREAFKNLSATNDQQAYYCTGPTKRWPTQWRIVT